MTPEKFQQLLEKFVSNEDAMLTFKRDEYTKGDTDVLLNFKQHAAFIGNTPMDVCVSHMMKHIQAITLAVERDSDIKLEWGISEGKEGLAQRFMDARNYLLLLAALIQDQEPVRKLVEVKTCMHLEDAACICKFTGEMPDLLEAVKVMDNGVVAKMDYGATVSSAIGYRVKTNQLLKNDEIMIKSVGTEAKKFFEDMLATRSLLKTGKITNKRFKFVGDRPNVDEAVKWLSPGVVSKMTCGGTNGPMFGYRVKNLGSVAADEIVVRGENNQV